MRTETHHKTYDFPDCHSIVICGDIHGDFINNDVLSEITNFYKIDTVVTHTAPSFCELQNKDGLLQWAIYDNSFYGFG